MQSVPTLSCYMLLWFLQEQGTKNISKKSEGLNARKSTEKLSLAEQNGQIDRTKRCKKCLAETGNMMMRMVVIQFNHLHTEEREFMSSPSDVAGVGCVTCLNLKHRLKLPHTYCVTMFIMLTVKAVGAAQK